MIYTWSFTRLLAAATQDELTDVIKSVDYILAATSEDGNTAYHRGTLAFSPADAENFLPFSEITEADLIAFTEATLGTDLDDIQADLEAQTANPVTERALPWIETHFA